MLLVVSGAGDFGRRLALARGKSSTVRSSCQLSDVETSTHELLRAFKINARQTKIRTC
jgi:hypothetical protein